MQRESALLLSFCLLIFFALVAYYGAQVTLWSSVILAIFLSIILLNFFYPITKLSKDQSDNSLICYGLFIIIGLIILAVYITQKTLIDKREY